MKKNKIILAGATVAIAGLALASCKKTEGGGTNDYNRDYYNYVAAPTAPSYDDLTEKKVNVWLNYSGTAGITYIHPEEYLNPVDQITYTSGALLPTWKRFAEVTKLELHDVADYTDKKDDDSYKKFSGQDYDTKNKEGVDLYSNSIKNINKMSTAGKAIDLTPYINDGTMPNFKKYLDEHPSIKTQITSNGGIYYTPYFDGYNKFERAFIMDTSMVEKLLDTDDFSRFDTTISGKGESSEKVVKEASYTPFIDATHNYKDATTTVKVSVNGTSKDITIKQTDNIIAQQNTSLAAGATGKALAEQFKTYLKNAFGDLVGEGKVYTKYSQIFTSEQAAYNCDELVALMRVVRANPAYLTNNDRDTVEIFFPRGEANNRVANILDLAQIWGVQGLDSEANNFYFDANGKLHSLASTPSSYEALGLLHSLFKEGLIEKNFYYVPKDNAKGTKNIAKYLAKTATDYGYGFMMYDYTAATGAANDLAEGVGTDPTTRQTPEGYQIQGVRAILPPLTMWANQTTWKHDQKLNDMNGKTLMRYTESNRALKTGSWCIPITAKNPKGAARLMDVTFSEWGALVNTFGPESYWYVPTGKDANTSWLATDISGDEKAPVFSGALVNAWQTVPSKTDFWSFMREYLGATHGIGGVRNNQCDYQATNAYAQVGVKNISNAIVSGAVQLAQVKEEYGFGTSVPTNYSGSVPETAAAAYEPLTQFWTDPKKESPDAWVTIVINGLDYTGTVCSDKKGGTKYTLAQVRDTEARYNELYIYALANSVSPDTVPDYAKATN